jgi:hypothetical protein
MILCASWPNSVGGKPNSVSQSLLFGVRSHAEPLGNVSHVRAPFRQEGIC